MNKLNSRDIIILTFFIIITYLYFNFYIFDQNIFRYTDQELTLSYNGYLMALGSAQEYTDHPGFFNIFILYIINTLKIALNLLPENFIELNKNTILNIQNLIESSRISNFFIFLSLFLIYLFLRNFNVNKLNSILSLIFITSSYSVYVHSLQLRTEFLSVILICASFYFLYKYFTKQKYKFIYFVLSIFFYYFALLNKTQIIVYYPFYLLLFMIIQEKIMISILSKKLLILSIILIPLNFFYYLKVSDPLSFIFNILIYITIMMIYMLTLYFKKIDTYRIINFLALNNLFFCTVPFITFQTIKTIDILSSSLFSNIFNPLRMQAFTNREYKIEKSHDFLLNSSELIFNRVGEYLINYFFIKENLIIILILITILICSFKERNSKIFFLMFLGFLFHIIISAITLNRYLAEHYFIYGNFFLLIIFLYAIFSLKLKKTLLLIAFIIINFIIIYLNFDNKNYDKYLSNLCKSSFISDFHKNIDYENFRHECKLQLN